jgi:uncharacterized protein (TIRG00374 family)
MLGGVGAAWRELASVEPAWIAVAVGCEIAAYGCFALHVRWVARGGHEKQAAPIRTALVLFGLGSVLPAAPLEGFALAGVALRRRRLDRERMALLFGSTQWFGIRALMLLASADVLVVLALSRVPVPYQLPAVLGAAASIALLLLTGWLSTRRRSAELLALAYLRLRHWRHPPPPEERRARGAAWHDSAMAVAGRGRDRAVLLGACVAAWVFEAMCLMAALRAVGAQVSVDVLVLAYTVGIIASLVPLVPAGAGVMETVTPLILHAYGVPLSTAVAAVLIYRLIASVLPALAGAVALLGLHLGAPAADDDGAPASGTLGS